MSLEPSVRQLLEQALAPAGGQGAGARLLDSAQRLWARVRKLLDMGIITADASKLDALELATLALQLPLREPLSSPTLAPAPLRDRAEASAELLVGEFGEQIDEALLDQTTRLLHELPQKSPAGRRRQPR